jgi:hypothetical protein
MDDDEHLERAMRMYEQAAIADIRRETDAMEDGLAAISVPGADGTPMPSTCHPCYAKQRQFITDWLERRPGAPSGPYLLLPKPIRPRRYEHFAADVSPTTPMLETLELQRRTACAPAPYVGSPYSLTWQCGVDKLGRAVAGEITYEFLYPGL